jgi:general secretion pathway protein A
MSILEYFKLNEEPFRISPNPRFLFLNEQVKEASAKVSYMTKHRTAPLYMYGAIGSGKTSILRRLYEELGDDQTYNLRLLIAPNVNSSIGRNATTLITFFLLIFDDQLSNFCI